MNNKISLELIWWVFTAVIIMLFLLPVYLQLGGEYPFYFINSSLIILFVTFTRYIFLLKHTWLAHLTWVKVVLVFLPIPLFFWVTDGLYNFQDYADKRGFANLLTQMQPDEAMNLSKYIRYQFIFFGTGTMIVLFLLPIRLLISVWLGVNRGKV